MNSNDNAGEIAALRYEIDTLKRTRDDLRERFDMTKVELKKYHYLNQDLQQQIAHLKISENRYKSLFEEEMESNLNNVGNYSIQVKDLELVIAGLRHELKYAKQGRGDYCE